MKTCADCGDEKDATGGFYAHPSTSDGRMARCKECHKRKVRENRAVNRRRYSDYDAARRHRPERKAGQLEATRKHRREHPEKYRARCAVSNAVRDGRLEKQPCRCGEVDRVQAHHHDYTQPLAVTWLCFKCHREEEHGQTVVRL